MVMHVKPVIRYHLLGPVATPSYIEQARIMHFFYQGAVTSLQLVFGLCPDFLVGRIHYDEAPIMFTDPALLRTKLQNLAMAMWQPHCHHYNFPSFVSFIPTLIT
jgi:hypothetical protein